MRRTLNHRVLWVKIAAILVLFTCVYLSVKVVNIPSESTRDKIETYNIFSTAEKELSCIPINYSLQNAIKNGFYYDDFRTGRTDYKRINEFSENTQQGKTDSIIMVQYTIEGDPIYTKILYDGKYYYVVDDVSRDRFKGGSGDYHEYKFKYLKFFEILGRKDAYFLNDSGITGEQLLKIIEESNGAVKFYPFYSIQLSQ